MNENIFLLINYYMPQPLQIISWLISELYGAVLFIAIGLIFLIINPKRALPRFLIGIIAITISGHVVDFTKKEFRRPRPMKYFKHITEEKHDELPLNIEIRFYRFNEKDRYPTEGFWVIGKPLKWNSFPSGHAQAAFCAAVALGMFIRRRWAWIGGLLFATLVALSRIVNGVHFPIDVLAGGAIGAASGWIVLTISRFFYPPAFAPWPRKYSNQKFRIAITAGEASADLYAGKLAKKLKENFGNVEIYGIGSKFLASAGARIVARSEDLSIMGFTGLAKAFPRIWKIQWRMREEAESNPPKLFIPIDLPDFNLALAKHHKRLGAKILYFIPPQVWAWRTGRIKKIVKRADAVCVVLPFELGYYEGKVRSNFVGHPLVEETQSELSDENFWSALSCSQRAPIFALAPGSRKQEIRYILKPMLEAARIIAKELPDLLFAIPLAPTLNKSLIQSYLDNFPDLKGKVTIFDGRAKEVFWRAKFGLICSGTATLEAMLCGMPHVIVYRAGKINFEIARRVAKVKWIGLPNLIAQKTVVPELIQNDATPEKMAESALKYLSDERLYSEMKSELERLAQSITMKNVYENVISVAKELVKDVSG